MVGSCNMDFVKTIKVIDYLDWDRLVQETYNKDYCIQQQEGCMVKGLIKLQVSKTPSDFDTDRTRLKFGEMGVNFNTWLETEFGKTPNLINEVIYWKRNFYPLLEILASDLCKKGLIDEGEYFINIDW